MKLFRNILCRLRGHRAPEAFWLDYYEGKYHDTYICATCGKLANIKTNSSFL